MASVHPFPLGMAEGLPDLGKGLVVWGSAGGRRGHPRVRVGGAEASQPQGV